MQYSVFVCDLNPKEIIFLKEDLGKILNLNEDRLLVINTGKVNKKNNEHVFMIGMQINSERETSIII